MFLHVHKANCLIFQSKNHVSWLCNNTFIKEASMVFRYPCTFSEASMDPRFILPREKTFGSHNTSATDTKNSLIWLLAKHASTLVIHKLRQLLYMKQSIFSTANVSASPMNVYQQASFLYMSNQMSYIITRIFHWECLNICPFAIDVILFTL